MKTITGFTAKTAENLLLDSGAFFLNFEVGTDTYETARSTKLLGATQGGGSFSAVPSIRQIAVDGVRGKAKGLERIDEWVVSMSSNLLEATKQAMKIALAACKEEAGPSGYKKITPKDCIELSDYIQNITWVGTLSGSDTPVIIQVYNVINDGGLSLSFTDRSEGIVGLNLSGHYDYSEGGVDLNPPFAIYYPEAS